MREESMLALPTLAAIRAKVIARVVDEEVTRYLTGVWLRACANCGRRFHPRMRWHFLCRDSCRRAWYRGSFHPKGR
jgi:hypothetical protein